MILQEGILNINKPSHMTSHGVVASVKKILGAKKAGHTGTLDPMATGVLPVCIGKSTRIIQYLDTDMKKYRCSMVLGIKTDTEDIWGKVFSRRDTAGITAYDVEEAFKPFSGMISQRPPMYSAVKINGKRLYEYAREGKEAEAKPRKVFISSLAIEDMALDGGEKSVTFSMECTKGTYVRALCRDIGDILGCGAVLSALERKASGAFVIENSVRLDELREMTAEEIGSLLMDTDFPLGKFGAAETGEEDGVKFINGLSLPVERCEILRRPFYENRDFYLPVRYEYRRAYNIYGRMAEGRKFLGVAFYNDKYKKLVAGRVFYSR